VCGPKDLRLIGEPLPRLGHFDQKGLELGIGRGARLSKATRGVSLIQFCDLHGRAPWRPTMAPAGIRDLTAAASSN
jgi:hypothetical protein